MWPNAVLKRQSSYSFIIFFPASECHLTMPIALFCWVSALGYGLIALVCHGEEIFLRSYLCVSELLEKVSLPFDQLYHPTGKTIKINKMV